MSTTLLEARIAHFKPETDVQLTVNEERHISAIVLLGGYKGNRNGLSWWLFIKPFANRELIAKGILKGEKRDNGWALTLDRKVQQ